MNYLFVSIFINLFFGEGLHQTYYAFFLGLWHYFTSICVAYIVQLGLICAWYMPMLQGAVHQSWR